jgi:endonuclease/exonuclease/phosphatase family metal-dependent hydrolase
MRIVTWNSRGKRRDIMTLITPILATDPDVICLQEVSRLAVDRLKKIPGYTLSFAYDFRSRVPKEVAIVATLTKLRPARTAVVKVSDTDNPFSLLNQGYRISIRGSEAHEAIIVELKVGKKTIRIANTRLSCAVGAADRIRSFRTLLDAMDDNAINILCGDFNIVDPPLFNVLTGWTRGFALADYWVNEREEVEKAIKERNLKNLFRGVSTWLFRWPSLQFDHIIIPENIRVVATTLWPNVYGSDHHILSATVDIPSV